MNNLDVQYQELLSDILKNGTRKSDRTGTGTLSVFGRHIRHKMSEGFPLITTKKVYWKGVVEELLWFLRGETNIKPLVQKDVNIWVGDCYQRYLKECKKIEKTEESLLQDLHSEGRPYTEREFIEKIKSDGHFADKWGELGPVYGKQWRAWDHFSRVACKIEGIDPHVQPLDPIDQIENLINDLRTNPDSRRLMVSAWNVAEIPDVVLPPCHFAFQCYTHELSLEDRINWAVKNECNFDVLEEFGINSSESLEVQTQRMHSQLTIDWNVPTRGLSLQWTQRSVDTALGLPFNIASYGLLLSLLAKHVHMVPYELIGILADTHIYLDQIDGVNEQLTREPFELPIIKIVDKPVKDIADYAFENIDLIGYKSHSSIKMPLSN